MLSRALFRISPLLLGALTIACEGYSSDPVQPTPAIAIQVNPTSLILQPGQRGDVTIVLTRTNYSGGGEFFVEGNVPPGVSASFSQAQLPNGTVSTTLRLTAAATAQAAAGSVVVRARGSGVTDQTATITVLIAATGSLWPLTSDLAFLFQPSSSKPRATKPLHDVRTALHAIPDQTAAIILQHRDNRSLIDP